jgi:hypothetical protein
MANYRKYLHRKAMEQLDGRVYDPPDPNIYGDPERAWHYPKKEDAMTDTDSPRTIPLTAEQIDALWDRWYNGEDAISADLTADEMMRLFVTAETAQTENVALRDRLARAEAEVVALRTYLWRIRDAVMHEGGWCYDYKTAEEAHIAEVVNVIWREARDNGHEPFATSTPTDGAAPPEHP